ADVSHELRTPLTVINGAAEVLLANPDLDDTVRNKVERIYRAGTTMAQTIAAFLLLAREPTSEKNTPNDTCSVAHIVRQQMDQLQHLIENLPIKTNLIITDEVAIAADPQLLSIIIANLLRNAYTYTKKGDVVVTLVGNQLWIEDTGPGIDPALRDRVFERSFQINNQDGDGSGIGLSIARRLANRYHWTITIDDRSGGGTKVILEFTT
ncbi:MAG: HAMP domain-containing histidine kinase, partial [Gammaproteobacteria bacterium]|nr:HAMP domain-containing histidine kinase [Gammaproteobacteria bacterium]